MNNRIVLIAGLCFTLIAGPFLSAQEETTGPKLSDAEIAKILVGTWLEELVRKDIQASAITIFKADGTFVSETTLIANRKTTLISVFGTWKVSNGRLIETIEGSDSNMAPEGKVSNSVIVSITDKKIVVKTNEGETVIMTKQEPKK